METRKAGRYGDMQADAQKFDAALQRNDSVQIKTTLGFLREHQKDALGTYQSALTNADRQDEAAKLLIARLADPRQSSAALIAVQPADARAPQMDGAAGAARRARRDSQGGHRPRLQVLFRR